MLFHAIRELRVTPRVALFIYQWCVVFCKCRYTFSMSCMLAPFSVVCRDEEEFSIYQVSLRTLPPPSTLLPSVLSLCKPGDMYSLVNNWVLVLTLTDCTCILFLRTICICVDSTACPFEFPWHVLLSYCCECTWYLSQPTFAISGAYYDIFCCRNHRLLSCGFVRFYKKVNSPVLCGTHKVL